MVVKGLTDIYIYIYIYICIYIISMTPEDTQHQRESVDKSVKPEACPCYNINVHNTFTTLCITVYSIAHNYQGKILYLQLLHTI